MSGFIDLSNLFNIASNSLGAINSPQEAKNQEEEVSNDIPRDSGEDTFQSAQTDTPRFDANSKNNRNRTNFNPLSIGFEDAEQKDENFTLSEFKTELSDIMGQLSDKNLSPEQRVELQDRVNDLMTNKFDQIQGLKDQSELAPEEEARVQRLAEDFDNAFNALDDQVAEDNAQAGNGGTLGNTADRLRNSLAPLSNGGLSETADRLRGELAPLKSDGSSIGRFAELVAKRRQAKLEQEALERRLSTQVDRLLSAVKVKDSIKLASSQG